MVFHLGSTSKKHEVFNLKKPCLHVCCCVFGGLPQVEYLQVSMIPFTCVVLRVIVIPKDELSYGHSERQPFVGASKLG